MSERRLSRTMTSLEKSHEIGRREALKLAATVSLAAGGTALTERYALGDAAEGKKLPYIDAHSHIWTRDIKSYPLAKNATLDDLNPPSFTTEELLSTCRPQGVGRVVLIAHSVFYGTDNKYMTDAAGEHPGVFRVVGMVDDLKPHVDRAMLGLAKKEVSGFRITARRKEKWLAGPGMELMWTCAAQTGQSICCLIDAQYLDSLGEMCTRHPGTSVVIDHFARIGVDGVIREADLAKLAGLAKHKNVTVKLSAFYALGKKKPPYDYLTPMIRRLLDAYGAERLMWASDAPYQMQNGNSYPASVQFMRDGLDFLSKGDRTHLMSGTAERVFFGELRGA